MYVLEDPPRVNLNESWEELLDDRFVQPPERLIIEQMQYLSQSHTSFILILAKWFRHLKDNVIAVIITEQESSFVTGKVMKRARMRKSMNGSIEGLL